MGSNNTCNSQLGKNFKLPVRRKHGWKTGHVHVIYIRRLFWPSHNTCVQNLCLFKHKRCRGGKALGCAGCCSGAGCYRGRAVGAAQQAPGWWRQPVEHRQIAVEPVGEGGGQLRQRGHVEWTRVMGACAAAPALHVLARRWVHAYAITVCNCNQLTPAAACWAPFARSGWTGRAG